MASEARHHADRQRVGAHRPGQRRGGWDTSFLRMAVRGNARYGAADSVLVFSVGGGDPERAAVSVNIVRALELAQEARRVGAKDRHRRPRRGLHRPGRRPPAVVLLSPFRRPRDPAHRGPLCRHLAPVGQPLRTWPAHSTKWGSRCGELIRAQVQSSWSVARGSSGATSLRPAPRQPRSHFRHRVRQLLLSGREWRDVEHHADDGRLQRGSARARSPTCHPPRRKAMQDHETVIHLASNPDIARAATEPAVDFDEGTLLTHHVVEGACRAVAPDPSCTPRAAGYTATWATLEATEDHGPAHSRVDLRRLQAGR